MQKEFKDMTQDEKLKYLETIVTQIKSVSEARLELLKRVIVNIDLDHSNRAMLIKHIMKDTINWCAAHEALHSSPINF